MKNTLFATLFAASLGTSLFAQAPLQVSNTQASGLANRQAIAEATSAWRSAHGPEWRTALDRETDFVRFLYGGHTESDGAVISDQDFVDLGQAYIGEAYPLLGIDPANLVLDEVVFLPLGMVGTTDKTTVQFRQLKDGVPVERGLVNALFDQEGRLLSLDTVGLPDALLPALTTPTRAAGDAAAFAAEAFSEETNLAARDLEVLDLEIVQEKVGERRQGTLAWRVSVANMSDGPDPKASILAISATGDARVVKRENQIHSFDVSGLVQTYATPGIDALMPSNPPVKFPAAYLEVATSYGTVYTDAQGKFSIPGAIPPLFVTFKYVGSFNDVHNQNGPDYSTSTLLTKFSGNKVFMNGSGAEEVTAQSNCFVYINAMRDWTRSINPADDKSDFVATSNPNIANACNAYYSPTYQSTNYYLAGGGCPNEASSSIIRHEMGHWMNDKYFSGNGSDGFGEGNADVFSMYQADSPLIGLNFYGPGTLLRTGENTRSFCGDTNPGCYGEVHDDGEVLMGALWKVRKRMNNSLGNTQGDALSNLLFNSWMNAYNDGQIKTIIETHWLTLDDDDGNVTNGSPHMADIDGGFQDQGFPGFQLTYVNITDISGPSDSLDQAGPYGVSAVITPNLGTALNGAALYYRVNEGFPHSVPMSMASGNRYFATIPGQPITSRIRWWIVSTNNLGQSDTYPSHAPAYSKSFTVGGTQVFYSTGFGVFSGWVHSSSLGDDDWQYGFPQGLAGDPPLGDLNLMGSMFGNDLGLFGKDGAYSANEDSYLRGPFIDLTGSVGAKLVFDRWLNVEPSIYDKASIRANGIQVWQNPSTQATFDTRWTTQIVDLGTFDGQLVQLEWRLKTDPIFQYGGWNVDNVSIVVEEPAPVVGLPTYYGTATPGSTLPLLDTAGQPAVQGNGDFVAKVKNGPSETPAFVLLGFAQTNQPLVGVTQLVQPTNVFNGQTDLFGQYEVPVAIPNDPALVGLTADFQAILVDAGGPQGFSATNGMQVVIVP